MTPAAPASPKSDSLASLCDRDCVFGSARWLPPRACGKVEERENQILWCASESSTWTPTTSQSSPRSRKCRCVTSLRRHDDRSFIVLTETKFRCLSEREFCFLLLNSAGGPLSRIVTARALVLSKTALESNAANEGDMRPSLQPGFPIQGLGHKACPARLRSVRLQHLPHRGQGLFGRGDDCDCSTN